MVKTIYDLYYKRTQFSNNVLSSNMDPLEPGFSDGSLPPVDIAKKLDSLENPAKPPIVMYKHMSHWEKFKSGMELADQEIVDRLQKLKGEDQNKPLPTEEEIRRRLNILKDQSPEQRPINIHEVDNRTNQEKADDLLKEYIGRLQLSSQSSLDNEIEARLKALRDLNSTAHSSRDSDDDDEDIVTRKMIKKAIAESKLRQEHANVDELEDMEIEGTPNLDCDEEQPSCVMCDQTNDLVKCSGCSGDLYCPLCFEDNHDDFELTKHKVVPFK